MRAIKSLTPFVLILASACSGGSPDPSDESGGVPSAFSMSDALQSDGPLRGVAFTGHVDRKNPKVRSTFAFTTEDTEVTAVVGLGEVGDGSTLVVTWFRVEGLEKRETLFSHEIAVGSSVPRVLASGRPPTTIASSDDLETAHNAIYGQTDVCSLSGGTDMPGTVVHFEATGSSNGSEDYTLPDLGEALFADLEGRPDAGSHVETGDRIDIHALAMVMPPALGVKTL